MFWLFSEASWLWPVDIAYLVVAFGQTLLSETHNSMNTSWIGKMLDTVICQLSQEKVPTFED